MSDLDKTIRWPPGKNGASPQDGGRISAEGAAGVANREAHLVVIAHPDERFLGTRYGLPQDGSLVIGRSPTADIAFPEIASISRHHVRLTFEDKVWVEDLGSTNGTLVDDVVVTKRREVGSGDRIQVGAVHFKLLHERDVEHAYHVAVYEMMMRDGVTQLFNRRKFDEEAQREFARASRYSRPLSLVLFDVDDFKKVNDTHGHTAGDSVLQRIAVRTREVTRAEQIIARLGGDEFAILCPEIDTNGATLFAERLRKAIAAIEHRAGDKTFHVTCSFGVAGWGPAFSTFDAFFEVADRALYASKEAGRDRLTIAEVSG